MGADLNTASVVRSLGYIMGLTQDCFHKLLWVTRVQCTANVSSGAALSWDEACCGETGVLRGYWKADQFLLGHLVNVTHSQPAEWPKS